MLLVLQVQVVGMSERVAATRALDGDHRWVVEACAWRPAAPRGACAGERAQADVSVRLDGACRCVLVDPKYRDGASDPVEFRVGLPFSLSLALGVSCG